jgi:hypothetical protein
MIKKFLLLTVFLLTISISFSQATYGYNNTNGYVNLSDSNPAVNINISLNCSNEIETFIHSTLTDSNGYYSFSGISDLYNSSAINTLCVINSSKKGVTNITNNIFSIIINSGTIDYFKGIQTNFTFNNTGNAIFDFSGLNGTLISYDGQGVKNKTIILNCPNQINTTVTNEYGFYNFSGISFNHYCTAQGCELLCNVSHLTEFTPFYIDPQGYYGETININITENINYNQAVSVNGEFTPSNGSYGNLTYFIYNATNYAEIINSCKYSNESKAFSDMIDFNSSAGKVFSANISTPVSGNYSYYVLCNTSLSVESIPKMVFYDIHLDGNNITINSPVNGSIFSKNSIFNITLDVSAINCYYKINYNTNAHTMTNTSFINFLANQTGLIEGENNIIFYCNDNYGTTSNKSMNFTADITAPLKAESFFATVTRVGNVLMTWNSVYDSERYYIYRGQSNQGAITFGLLANISAQNTYYEDLNLQKYQTYYYKITAGDISGNEGAPAYSSGVYIVSEQDYKTEIYNLVRELDVLKNETIKTENELKETNEILARAVIVKNDLEFFKEYISMLSLSDIETINNIKYLMNDYENKNLEELKSMNYQVDYNLNTYLKEYKKFNTINTINTTINSLNITSIINESRLEINGKTYYKYIINNTIFNPSNNFVKNINLTFKVPKNAEILGFENINSTINYEISSIESMQEQTISYSFLSLSNYDNNITANMIETLMPKQMTAYQVLTESKNNTAIGLIIWSLTLILSISLLFQYKNYHINFKNRQNSN